MSAERWPAGGKLLNSWRVLPRILLSTPFRQSAVYVSVFCAAVALTFIYVYMSLQNFLAKDAQALVQADLEVLQQRYQTGGLPSLLTAINERSTPSSNALYLLTDGAGNKLSGNLEAVSTGLWNNVGPVSFAYRRISGERTVQRQAYGVVVRLPRDLHLVIGRDVEEQEAVKRLMRWAFLWGYGVIALIGLAGGVLLSRRILSRVDEASGAAGAIMQGNLAERIPVTGRQDEFDRLSENLNAMLDRIQDLMAGLKDVSDNIAHDLKTPLHRLRTRAERALQTSASPEKLAEALGAVIEEADALIQTFDALLSIARLEAGSRSGDFGVFNICALVRDVVDLYEPAGEEHGLSFRLNCACDITMAGEKHLLGQALANLLDNAIKYGRGEAPGDRSALGEVDITLEDRGDEVHILVGDRGPGIPEEDRERVLHRFVRLQPSRSIPGSGLGLSLVAAVARLHGGSISLEDNRPGLRVRLRLKKNLPPDAQSPSKAIAAPTVLVH